MRRRSWCQVCSGPWRRRPGGQAVTKRTVVAGGGFRLGCVGIEGT